MPAELKRLYAWKYIESRFVILYESVPYMVVCTHACLSTNTAIIYISMCTALHNNRKSNLFGGLKSNLRSVPRYWRTDIISFIYKKFPAESLYWIGRYFHWKNCKTKFNSTTLSELIVIKLEFICWLRSRAISAGTMWTFLIK